MCFFFKTSENQGFSKYFNQNCQIPGFFQDFRISDHPVVTNYKIKKKNHSQFCSYLKKKHFEIFYLNF